MHILHIPGGFLMTVFKGHRQKLCSQNIMFQEHNLTSAFYDISVLGLFGLSGSVGSKYPIFNNGVINLSTFLE